MKSKQLDIPIDEVMVVHNYFELSFMKQYKHFKMDAMVEYRDFEVDVLENK